MYICILNDYIVFMKKILLTLILISLIGCEKKDDPQNGNSKIIEKDTAKKSIDSYKNYDEIDFSFENYLALFPELELPVVVDDVKKFNTKHHSQEFAIDKGIIDYIFLSDTHFVNRYMNSITEKLNFNLYF